MTPTEAKGICAEVFAGWTVKFSENNATPLLCLGVGHSAHSGEIHLCVRDDPSLTTDALRSFLRHALRLL